MYLKSKKKKYKIQNKKNLLSDSFKILKHYRFFHFIFGKPKKAFYTKNKNNVNAQLVPLQMAYIRKFVNRLYFLKIKILKSVSSDNNTYNKTVSHIFYTIN